MQRGGSALRPPRLPVQCLPMRWFLFVTLAFYAAPAFGQAWESYGNARFGYEIAIPPGFAESAPPPTNGDGQIYSSPDGRAELRVWGANVLEGFPVEFNAMVAMASSEGWEVSIPAGFATDAAFEGHQNGQRIVVHAISYCTGALMAAFQLTYDSDLKANMIQVITRLSHSLDRTSGFMCP
jgi:hypothetical protein